jgi:hypothetical protein
MCKFLLQISKHDNQDIISQELFKQHNYSELKLIMFSAFNELNFSSLGVPRAVNKYASV